MSTRNRSAEELILGCKEVGCPWDPDTDALYVWNDTYGRIWWRRRIRCLNCGSTKYEKYAVGDTLLQNRIGKPDYDRPDGWYELKVYWGKARSVRARRGLIALPAAS